MLERRELHRAQYTAAPVIACCRCPQLPLLIIAQCRHHALFADGLHFHSPTRIERVRNDPVGKLDDAVPDRVLAQDIPVDYFVAIGQMRLHPSSGGVGVETLEQVKAVAGAVEERAGLVDDKGLQRADFSRINDGLHLVIAGVKAAIGAHVEHDVVVLAGFDHAVGFGQRGRERLFRVNRPGTRFGGRHDDLGPVLGLSGNADDVRGFAGEHFAVVGVLLVRGNAVALAHLFHYIDAQV